MTFCPLPYRSQPPVLLSEKPRRGTASLKAFQLFRRCGASLKLVEIRKNGGPSKDRIVKAKGGGIVVILIELRFGCVAMEAREETMSVFKGRMEVRYSGSEEGNGGSQGDMRFGDVNDRFNGGKGVEG